MTKILLTHRHSDHSGSIVFFPIANIHVNEGELGAEKLEGIKNIVPVSFTDGSYHNFPESQKIQEGIYYNMAKGHTKGNSIVIVEDDGLYYMIHGDVSYVDATLYANKLSAVYDDLAAACVTPKKAPKR